MRLLALILILVLSVGCDQVTKATAQEYLQESGPVSMWGGALRLHYAENPGGMLGWASHLSPELRDLLFQVAALPILAGLLLLALFKRNIHPADFVGLSVIAGGGIGNIADRIVSGGVVRDFLTFGIGSLRTGIFNLADVFIFAGIAVVLWGRFKEYGSEGFEAISRNHSPDSPEEGVSR